jgi:hypothetical protein
VTSAATLSPMIAAEKLGLHGGNDARFARLANISIYGNISLLSAKFNPEATAFLSKLAIALAASFCQQALSAGRPSRCVHVL